VPYAARDFTFALQPPPEVGVRDEARAQGLDRDHALVCERERFEHHAGSAQADALHDLVASIEHLPDQVTAFVAR
jgi:hypothetical protein